MCRCFTWNRCRCRAWTPRKLLAAPDAVYPQFATHNAHTVADPEVKAQLGARFTMTRHAVFIRNPLLRALGRRFAGHFESDSEWR